MEFSPARRALPDYGDLPEQPTLVPGRLEATSSPLTEGDPPFFPVRQFGRDDVDAMEPTFQEDVLFETGVFTADPEVTPAAPTMESQPTQGSSEAEPKEP